MASSADGMAHTAKTNLRSSIMITNNLTLNSPSPSDFIMHRMNEVLRAVVDTNFDSPSMEAVGSLYAAIAQSQAHMMDNAHDIALVNLSRTFAVVMEEAIKMRGTGTGSNNNNNNNDWGSVGNGAQSGMDAWQAHNGSYGRPPASLMNIEVGQKGFGAPAKSAFVNTNSAATLSPEAAAAAAAARRLREQKKDYSPEAIEGRITVFNIPLAVTEQQVRAHFIQIGELSDLSYPTEHGRHKGFALIKFKDNTKADAAVDHLHGSLLGGERVTVERAKYWFKKNAAPAFGTLKAGFGSGTGSGSGSGSDRKPAGHDSILVSSSSASNESHQTMSSSEFTVPAPHETSDESSEAADDEESTDESGSDPGIC